MTTQKALLLTEIGAPLSLTHDWPIPSPSTAQVQVKVLIAGINPHDAKSRDWGLFIRLDRSPPVIASPDERAAVDLPNILTHDVVGKITKLGPGVTGLRIGDRVTFQASFWKGSKQNGLQEYAVADVGALSKIPEGISDDEAATLPTTVFTSVTALFHNLAIPAPWSEAARDFDYAGASVLVVGGGSSCGQTGVQLAALAGIGRIVVVGGDESTLRSFGATHFVDRHGGEDVVLGRIRDIVGDELVYAYDTVNVPENQVLTVNALSGTKKGVMARLLPMGPIDESKVLGKEAGFEVSDVFGSSHIHTGLAAEFWGRLEGYLEQGSIKPLDFVVKEGLDADVVNGVLDDYRDHKKVTRTNIHV
ncbi:putative alcohol dehydrogenase [Aspergillus karnatakaensis]|uniref:zinc-binding alcohol dehydrogenase family protein n=1 Tax=Aspergillus karnatakaensis TaxID=1810916 RepID=UPI003CCDD5CB